MSVELPTRGVDPLSIDAPGQRECLLGNEAIVRGALEAGVVFAAGYPGTPSSEITDGFARIARSGKLAFEYAVNEKIALELAFAASLAGARAICAMKHLGLMVAGDPLSTIPYVGVEGGLVIVSAGDPSCHTSPNEADQRHLGPMLHIPVLDPATPAEALELTRFAFELSEQTRLPVLMRTTTRLAHSRAVVELGELRAPVTRGFVRDPGRYVPVPASARRMRLDLSERIKRARALVASSGMLKCSGAGKDAILTSGAPAATTADLLREHGLEGAVQLWRLASPHPLPEDEIAARLSEVERVLVVEELSPFLENAILALIARRGLRVQVLGKLSEHLPEAFEYEPAVIQRGLHTALGLGPAPSPPRPVLPVTPRAPSLCPGCPHRAAFFAARAAFPEEQLYFNDIGCYTLGCVPPLSTADALLCMGAGFTLAAGVSRVTGKRTVGFLGDSTFFHAGMPALLDCVKEKANVVAVVLDNEVTAMTGFQQSPTRSQKVEDVARALGAEHVETIDPYDLDGSIAAFRRAAARTDTSVVVVRRACPVHEARRAPRTRASFVVDPERCRRCGRDEHGLRCSVPLTEGYERNLARVTSTQTQRGETPAIAPCATRCPLTLCIQGYAGHIAAGEYPEAVQHVVERTPLPESICRVCHRPCEDACVRSAIDQPIAVNDLKRFVVEWAERERPELLQIRPGEPNGRSIAVVGAGVTGLSAARELRARGYSVTLLDERPTAGGMLSHGIPEYRLPKQAVAKDVARVLELGVRFEGGRKLGRDMTLNGLLSQGYDAVLVAVGAWRARKLDLPRAKRGPQVIEALAYLSAVRAGEPVPSATRVVVIGGGNAAIDAARTALRRGATEVRVVCLETRAAMPALRDEIAAAEHEGIVIAGARRPVRCDELGLLIAPLAGGSEQTLVADLVIVAIGQDPDLDLDLDLERDAQGTLVVDPATGRTSHPRVFAGGDVVAGERTVTAAAAWGLRAAWGIDVEIRGREIADRRPPPLPPSRDESWRSFADVLEAPKAARRVAPEAALTERRCGFAEVTAGLSEADARAEAARCLMCGLCGNCRACVDTLGCPALGMHDDQVAVTASLCIGCGVCADLCTNGALAPRGRS